MKGMRAEREIQMQKGKKVYVKKERKRNKLEWKYEVNKGIRKDNYKDRKREMNKLRWK
jgi:hypothetical protein